MDKNLPPTPQGGSILINKTKVGCIIMYLQKNFRNDFV
jgi:hypothetical protein